MTDRLSPERRSALMSRIRGKNTFPELTVRRLVSGLGYRYRLHHKKLPGTPDLAFPSRRKAILVHGCFWHGHKCMKGRLPKSRLRFWREKIVPNRRRDRIQTRQLAELGWSVLVVWSCQLKKTETMKEKIRKFLLEN